MVGYINCYAKPEALYLLPFSPHGVELGFTVFPPFRRQGYAREACLALMKWAHEDYHVPEFVVSIAADNLPSRQLAEGLGFTRVGSQVDEDDGPERSSGSGTHRLRQPARDLKNAPPLMRYNQRSCGQPGDLCRRHG